jgi:hypothetical protein
MSKEAMKQAYEVPLVEQLESVPNNAKLVIDDADGMGTRYIPVGRMCHDASKALRQAIAEAEKQEQGEPVAVKHMMEWADYLKRKSDYGQHMQIPSEMSAGACWELAVELEQFINTTPQQRSESSGKPAAWVGLTSEDYNEIFEKARTGEHAVQLAEAKLKEKNT